MQRCTKEIKLTKYKDNLSEEERRSLNELKKMEDIIILPSDKGGELCIIKKEIYTAAGEEHLNDTNVYKKIKRITASTIEKKINLE